MDSTPKRSRSAKANDTEVQTRRSTGSRRNTGTSATRRSASSVVEQDNELEVDTPTARKQSSKTLSQSPKTTNKPVAEQRLHKSSRRSSAKSTVERSRIDDGNVDFEESLADMEVPDGSAEKKLSGKRHRKAKKIIDMPQTAEYGEDIENQPSMYNDDVEFEENVTAARAAKREKRRANRHVAEDQVEEQQNEIKIIKTRRRALDDEEHAKPRRRSRKLVDDLETDTRLSVVEHIQAISDDTSFVGPEVDLEEEEQSNIDVNLSPVKPWEEIDDPEIAELSQKVAIVQEKEATNFLRSVMSPKGLLSDLEAEFESRIHRPVSPSKYHKSYSSYNEIHRYCCPHHGCRYKLLIYNTGVSLRESTPLHATESLLHEHRGSGGSKAGPNRHLDFSAQSASPNSRNRSRSQEVSSRVRAERASRQSMSARKSSQRFSTNRYNKFYDPYDSHDENEEGCPDCDRHSRERGRHADCCPRYVGPSEGFVEPETEETLGKRHSGSSPKKRQIRQLAYPGQKRLFGDTGEMESEEEFASDGDSHMRGLDWSGMDEDKSASGFAQKRPQSEGGYLQRTRARSEIRQSKISNRSYQYRQHRFKKFYGSHDEDEHECPHCEGHSGEQGRHADCCPRYVGPSEDFVEPESEDVLGKVKNRTTPKKREIPPLFSPGQKQPFGGVDDSENEDNEFANNSEFPARRLDWLNIDIDQSVSGFVQERPHSEGGYLQRTRAQSQRRRSRIGSKRQSTNRFKKSYDPYDSHDENEEGCPHCDRHTRERGRHADCCPRYVGPSEDFVEPETEDILGKAKDGTTPKKRQIQPLTYPGQKQPFGGMDDGENEDNEFANDSEFPARRLDWLNIDVDQSVGGFVEERPHSEGGYLQRIRAQSQKRRSRVRSGQKRFSTNRYNRFYDPYDSHEENEEGCPHCHRDFGERGKQSDCCPRYVGPSESFTEQDSEDILGKTHSGSSPKKRDIHPLAYPGQKRLFGAREGVENEDDEFVSDTDSNVKGLNWVSMDEDKSASGFLQLRPQSEGGYLQRTRAQSQRRSRNNRYQQRRSTNRFKKFYDAYDSHDENEDGCPHCDRHSEERGRHADCCPRYVGPSEDFVEREDVLGKALNGTSPKKRHIEPLGFPGQKKPLRDMDDGENEDNEFANDSKFPARQLDWLNIDVHQSVRGFVEERPHSEGGYLQRTRAQSQRRRSRFDSKGYQQRRSGNRFKKSYDPYDSHDENEEGCTHCDKHSGERGRHADCCPRYVGPSEGFVEPEKEDVLGKALNGTSPKKRQIQALKRFGDRGEIESEEYDSDADSHVRGLDWVSVDEGQSVSGFVQERGQSEGGYFQRTRAQSQRKRSRIVSKRQSTNRFRKSYDPYDSHDEHEEGCTHCNRHSGERGRHADCCPRYVGPSEGFVEPEREDVLGKALNGTSPKKRQIQALKRFGDRGEIESEEYDSDADSHVRGLDWVSGDEGQSVSGFVQERGQSEGGYFQRTRAQSQRKKSRIVSKRQSTNRFRKSYDPYDSHDEHEEGCTHCNRHSGERGRHTDCCPRYVGPSEDFVVPESEDVLGKAQNGTSPKKRQIQALKHFGDTGDMQSEEYDSDVDSRVHGLDWVSVDEGRSPSGLVQERAQSEGGYLQRIRAQSQRRRSRIVSKRQSTNRFKKSYDPYDSHNENEEGCPHCDRHSGERGRHADCCPRYVGPSEDLVEPENEDVLGKAQNGTSPKKRQIQALKHFGDTGDIQSEEYDSDADSRVHGLDWVSVDEGRSLSGFVQERAQSEGGYLQRTRAQSQKRRSQTCSKRRSTNRFKKSYDPYDSHDENEEGCAHCDRHSGERGRHADCCPRYVGPSEGFVEPENEDVLGKAQNGTSPKKRQIQALKLFGDTREMESEEYDTDADAHAQGLDWVSVDEGQSVTGFVQDRAQSEGGYLQRTRAQSQRRRSRIGSKRQSTNRFKRSYDPYDSHNENEEGCPHCDRHSGERGRHADCCPRYVGPSESFVEPETEDILGKTQNGTTPKKRQIQPLSFPGDIENDDAEFASDRDSQVGGLDWSGIDEDKSVSGFVQKRPQSEGAYSQRTRAQRRQSQMGSKKYQQRRSTHQFKRSYDPYDSHDENEEGCPHCDRHSGERGRHADCCPRYVGPSEDFVEPESEDVLGKALNGTSPKKRQIQPLVNPGDIENDDAEFVSERDDSHMGGLDWSGMDEDKSVSGFVQKRPQSEGAYSQRTRAQSQRLRNRKTQIKSCITKYRSTYNEHDESEGTCLHCSQHTGLRYGHQDSDCCPRYIDPSIAVDKYASDTDVILRTTTSLTSPRQRQIPPLRYPDNEARWREYSRIKEDSALSNSKEDYMTPRSRSVPGRTRKRRLPPGSNLYRQSFDQDYECDEFAGRCLHCGNYSELYTHSDPRLIEIALHEEEERFKRLEREHVWSQKKIRSSKSKTHETIIYKGDVYIKKAETTDCDETFSHQGEYDGDSFITPRRPESKERQKEPGANDGQRGSGVAHMPRIPSRAPSTSSQKPRKQLSENGDAVDQARSKSAAPLLFATPSNKTLQEAAFDALFANVKRDSAVTRKDDASLEDPTVQQSPVSVYRPQSSIEWHGLPRHASTPSGKGEVGKPKVDKTTASWLWEKDPGCSDESKNLQRDESLLGTVKAVSEVPQDNRIAGKPQEQREDVLLRSNMPKLRRVEGPEKVRSQRHSSHKSGEYSKSNSRQQQQQQQRREIVQFPDKSLQEAAFEALTAVMKNENKPPKTKQIVLKEAVVYSNEVYRPSAVYSHFRSTGKLSQTATNEKHQSFDVDPIDNKRMVDQKKFMSVAERIEKDKIDPIHGDIDSDDRTSAEKRAEKSETSRSSAFVVVRQTSSASSSTSVSQKSRSTKEIPDEKVKADIPPLDLSQHNMIAKLWMELVDKKTVVKSKTMYISIVPDDLLPPDELIRYVYGGEQENLRKLPACWIIARGRNPGKKQTKPKYPVRSQETYSIQPPNVGQSILFFEIGSLWPNLAVVLFESVQTMPEITEMIKDIQRENTYDLSQQILDLMQRWWKCRNKDASIEELQRGLRLINVPSISEFTKEVTSADRNDTSLENGEGQMQDRGGSGDNIGDPEPFLHGSRLMKSKQLTKPIDRANLCMPFVSPSASFSTYSSQESLRSDCTDRDQRMTLSSQLNDPYAVYVNIGVFHPLPGFGTVRDQKDTTAATTTLHRRKR